MIDLKLLIKDRRCKKLPGGKKIEFSDDSGHPAMYILIVGKVRIVNDDPSFPATISPGEAFGGYEFFYGGSDTVYIADADSVVYVITEDSFYETAQAHPKALYEILKAAYAKPADAARKSVDNAESPKPEPESAKVKITEEKIEPAIKVISSGLFPEGHKGYPGIVNPEFAKLVFKKDYKCPLCEKTFKDYKVFKSKLVQGKPIRYDLRQFYAGFQMEWYEIVTCPHCYFSVFFNYFTEPKALQKDKIKASLAYAQKAITLDFNVPRDMDYVFAAHYLALCCAPGYLLQRRHLQAKLWGNLSWLYEDAADEEMACLAASEAAKAYEELYLESTLSPVQEQSVSLTIAGMLYRAGQKENMRKYLFNARTSSAGNKVYIDLADDLMEILRGEK